MKLGMMDEHIYFLGWKILFTQENKQYKQKDMSRVCLPIKFGILGWTKKKQKNTIKM